MSASDAPSSTSAPDRAAGPPPPIDVRSSGDDDVCPALERAIACSGRVERATHGFHTYPAGMHADCAREIIAIAPPGAVHDPFCGGGTVLVEALLAGRSATGTDLSPVAMLVSRARTADPALATAMRSAARKLAAAARLRTDTEVPQPLREWYEEHVAYELGRLRDGIAAVQGPERILLNAVMSSILVKVSWRESDTSNRRRPYHRPPGTTAVLFHKKARELGRMMEALPAGDDRPRARLKLADARVQGPPPGTSLVLTSPPYPGVYDYVPMQQLRHIWLGLDAGHGLGAELGSRRSFRAMGRGAALRTWREDTGRWIATQVAGLAPGGQIAIVVGDGLVGGRTVDTLSPTIEALRAAGARIRARASADRPDHARETVRTEHVVLAQRD